MLLCGLVAYVLRNAPARVFWLWILVAVGAHFLMLARAQGPLLLVLGLLCIVNAALGLWQASIPFLVCWFIDGALKIISGNRDGALVRNDGVVVTSEFTAESRVSRRVSRGCVNRSFYVAT
jgi:hypothetical protein